MDQLPFLVIINVPLFKLSLNVQILGAMISQYLIGEMDENSVYNSSLLAQAGIAVVLQFANIGSAAIFFLSALPLFSALALNPFFSGPTPRLSLWTYAIGSLLPSISGVLLLLGVVDVFVPLVCESRARDRFIPD